MQYRVVKSHAENGLEKITYMRKKETNKHTKKLKPVTPAKEVAMEALDRESFPR